MTLTELNEHYKKLQKLRETKELLANVRAKDKYGELTDVIDDLTSSIAKQEKNLITTNIAVIEFINGIQDAMTRKVFCYRFVYGQPWQDVAANFGKGYTEEAMKQVCYRFLRKNR